LFGTRGSLWPSVDVEKILLAASLLLSALLTVAFFWLNRRYPGVLIKKRARPLSLFTKILLTLFMALIFVPGILYMFVERMYLPFVAGWMGGKPFVVQGMYTQERFNRRRIHEMLVTVPGQELLMLNDRIDFELRGVQQICEPIIGQAVQLSGVKNALGYVIRAVRGPACLITSPGVIND
jgi:hypothetical protein